MSVQKYQPLWIILERKSNSNGTNAFVIKQPNGIACTTRHTMYSVIDVIATCMYVYI